MPVIPFQIAPRPAYKPTPRQEDPEYLEWIRTQPCVIPGCRAHYVEAAHTGSRGLGTKADDRNAIPLCPHHHQHGPHSFHRLGRRAFEAFWKICIRDLISEFNCWYDNQETAA